VKGEGGHQLARSLCPEPEKLRFRDSKDEKLVNIATFLSGNRLLSKVYKMDGFIPRKISNTRQTFGLKGAICSEGR
jgi:hypothetical protein